MKKTNLYIVELDKSFLTNGFPVLSEQSSIYVVNDPIYTKYSLGECGIRPIPILRKPRRLIPLDNFPTETNQQFFTILNARRAYYPQSIVCDQVSTLHYQDQFRYLQFPFHGVETIRYCEILSSVGPWFWGC
jgi:hypothetical protein